MDLAFIKTRSALGIHAKSVSVEVHLSNGLPAFTIVGLPEAAVKESKDRVRSAILTSQFEFPCRRITVNLGPADLPKVGSGFDLPIAIGILVASGQLSAERLNSHEFIGELALSGELRAVQGIIPVVLAAHREDHTLIIPSSNAQEAAITGYEKVYSALNLRQVCYYLEEQISLERLPLRAASPRLEESMDWSDVKGQAHAKRAMIIAAAGGHSVLLNGPPGSGKTMLAKRFSTLLPDLSETDALECAAIHSIRGKQADFSQWLSPPVRSPHHTASAVALVGGGSPPKPGEISLAHNGVLFLDELPEFSKQVLETLREPLESGSICISRAAIQMEFPARFQLIAAMNPCPCGHWGNAMGDCLCSPDRINRYLAKLSGPFLDRIDIHIQVSSLSKETLITPHTAPSGESFMIREQVKHLHDIQRNRQGHLNAALSVKACEQLCLFGASEQAFIAQVMNKLNLSARAYHRLLKVARTIADWDRKETVDEQVLLQALAFRQLVNRPK